MIDTNPSTFSYKPYCRETTLSELVARDLDDWIDEEVESSNVRFAFDCVDSVEGEDVCVDAVEGEDAWAADSSSALFII